MPERAPGPPLDLVDPAILQDPHPTYRAAFAHGPLRTPDDTGHRTWFLGGHAEISALLRDPRMSADRVAHLTPGLPEPQRRAVRPLLDSLSHWLLFLDPPRHTPLRRCINAALSQRLVRQRRPAIESLVTELLDAVAPQGRLDVVADLAYPLPAIVVAEMLGARPEDRDALRGWSQDIARLLGTVPAPAVVVAAQRSVLAMTDYFREVLARHRAAPRDDLLGALLALQAQTPQLHDQALLANCVALVFAGHETTTNLIGNAVHLLLDRPDTLQRLRDAPDGWSRALEEVLRFESPVQRVSRVTTAPVEVAGATIPAGARVVMVLAAANRDPRVFDRPDVFEPSRDPNPHLGFGFGLHHCSGAGLARVEARAALQGLLQRFDGLTREQPPRFTDNFGLRSLPSLPVAFVPRA